MPAGRMEYNGRRGAVGPLRPRLALQRRPRRVGRVAGRYDLALVVAGEVDRIKPRPPFLPSRVLARLAEIHQHPPVGRPCRTLDVKVLDQDPFTRSVGAHHAYGKHAAGDFGESDQVAARRPYRRRVAPLAETDAARLAALDLHDVDLLPPAAVGVEH